MLIAARNHGLGSIPLSRNIELLPTWLREIRVKVESTDGYERTEAMKAEAAIASALRWVQQHGTTNAARIVENAARFAAIHRLSGTAGNWQSPKPIRRQEEPDRLIEQTFTSDLMYGPLQPDGSGNDIIDVFRNPVAQVEEWFRGGTRIEGQVPSSSFGGSALITILALGGAAIFLLLLLKR